MIEVGELRGNVDGAELGNFPSSNTIGSHRSFGVRVLPWREEFTDHSPVLTDSS